MKTFTDLRTLTARYCNLQLEDTAAMTVVDNNVNDSVRTMCNLQGGKLRFLETTKDILTVADQEAYQIPNKFRKLIDLYVINAGDDPNTNTIYMPQMVFDPTKWKWVKALKLGVSDVPYFTYVENKRFFIAPIPSSTGNTIVLRGRLNTTELVRADYTTGTIVSIANEATTVTGSGTSWNASMVGSYIQIAESSSANGGDGFWYEIASVTSTTVLELTKVYEGTSIVAGSAAYTIGQCSVIPEAYDVGIVYRATALYWQNQNDLARAKMYWLMYDGGNEAGYSREYGGLIGQMLANEGETEEGSYLPPFDRYQNGMPQIPYYLPYQDASGFNP